VEFLRLVALKVDCAVLLIVLKVVTNRNHEGLVVEVENSLPKFGMQAMLAEL
jgi:hypothetical protein